MRAREELVERLLLLARDLAFRYSHTDEPFDDLFQVACLGLVKAIDRFEPELGTKFTSNAAPTILGGLKRRFRDKGRSVHVARNLQERALAVGRETEVLSKQLGRSPKVREVAHSLDCSIEDARVVVPSPPPPNNFDVIPTVRSLTPMQDIRRDVASRTKTGGETVANPTGPALQPCPVA